MVREILLAEGAGFCFGVKRAIDIAFNLAQRESKGIFTYGPIIHNPQVVEKLKELGLEPKEQIDSSVKKLIIRAHGIPKDKLSSLKDSGVEIIDATCPFVKRAQSIAEELAKEGYQVLIIGDSEHPEVKGILSYAGHRALVVNSEDIPTLDRKIGIIQQTTQPLSKVKEILNKIILSLNEFDEIRTFNTICNFTVRRLESTKKLAKNVDMMIVVGGKNSANTTQLANLCRQMGVKTYHIEDAEEIEKSWFDGAEKVGVTAGASTPNWIINQVIDKIKSLQT